MELKQRKPRAMAAVLIICAVVLGGLGGIAFDRLVLLPRVGYAGPLTAADSVRASTTEGRWQERSRSSQGRRASGDRYLRHLQNELQMSEEQTAQISEILSRQQERVNAITRETRPRIREVAADTRGAMREVLSDDQWERFQELRRSANRRRGAGNVRDSEARDERSAASEQEDTVADGS